MRSDVMEEGGIVLPHLSSLAQKPKVADLLALQTVVTPCVAEMNGTRSGGGRRGEEEDGCE